MKQRVVEVNVTAQNFQVYRTRLRTAEGPVLPFLGQLLSE